MLTGGTIQTAKSSGAEKITRIFRPSWLARFWLVSGAVVFLLAPFFLLYPLFSFGRGGIAVFLALFAFGLFLAAKFWAIHSFTAIVLTAAGLIDMDKKGFFARTVTRVPYEKIQNVSFKSAGLVSSFFKLGDVYVDLVGDATRGKTRLKFTGVKNPDEVCGEILFWQRRAAGFSAKKEAKAVYLLEKIRRRVGDREFAKLIGD